MVNGRLGEIGADRILEMVDSDHRGNGRWGREDLVVLFGFRLVANIFLAKTIHA